MSESTQRLDYEVSKVVSVHLEILEIGYSSIARVRSGKTIVNLPMKNFTDSEIANDGIVATPKIRINR